MNIIRKIIEATKEGNAQAKNIFYTKNYHFLWNSPATEIDIINFSADTGIEIPPIYRDILLETNGAVLFMSEGEDDGFRLFGLNELKAANLELVKAGYDIPNGYFCFCQCLYCDDYLLIDMNHSKNYIIDGDVGYPPSEWKHLHGDLNSFLINLCMCNGATYWRW